jgi:general L-amino acid transport system substrate-binding protein
LIRAIALGVALLALASAPVRAASRLEAIKSRGFLTCGVEPAVPGFADVDAAGRYRGFDVDICRAIAAAIFGTPDKVRFIPARIVTELAKSDEIDVVSRRLTWELQREAPLGLQFGPITFYDGQGFLVPRARDVRDVAQLARRPICVAGGTVFEVNLNAWSAARRLTVRKVILESAFQFDEIAEALKTGRCPAYTADVSELGAIRQKTGRSSAFVILPPLISKEPLAPLVRQDDPQFFAIVRWTVFALIQAEELGVTSANVNAMRDKPDATIDVQRLLGAIPGNGKALGLSESWAHDVIKTLGNYGEIFERNLGAASGIGLERGLNRLWTKGGLMFAPPLR